MHRRPLTNGRRRICTMEQTRQLRRTPRRRRKRQRRQHRRRRRRRRPNKLSTLCCAVCVGRACGRGKPGMLLLQRAARRGGPPAARLGRAVRRGHLGRRWPRRSFVRSWRTSCLPASLPATDIGKPSELYDETDWSVCAVFPRRVRSCRSFSDYCNAAPFTRLVCRRCMLQCWCVRGTEAATATS